MFTQNFYFFSQDEFIITSNRIYKNGIEEPLDDPKNQQIELLQLEDQNLTSKKNLESSLDMGHNSPWLQKKKEKLLQNICSKTFMIPGIYIVFFCSIFSFVSNNIKIFTYQIHSDFFITLVVATSALVKC